MRLSTVLCVILGWLIISPSGWAQNTNGNSGSVDTPFSKVKRDNLLNGLQIVTLERPEETTIRCTIVLRGGAMFDGVGKTGLSALTQRTLLAVNPRIREEMESLQTKVEWGIDWDKTWYHLEGPPNNFEAALEILGRLLVVENIRAEAFKRAQQEQIEAIRAGLPLTAKADEAFQLALYGEHPYGHTVNGSELTVSGLRQGDVYDIFQRFYLANNASAIIVGKVTAEKALRAFKFLFGGWSKGAIVPATFRQPVSIGQARVVRIDEPKAEQFEVRGGIAGAKYSSPEFPLTQLMAEILTQRWKKESKEPVAGIGFEVERRTLPSPIFFGASLSPAEAERIAQRMPELFAALASSPVGNDELAEARSAVISRLTPRSVEEWLRDIETFSLPRNYPLTIKSRLEAVTAAELQSLAKKLLEANAVTTVILGRGVGQTVGK